MPTKMMMNQGFHDFQSQWLWAMLGNCNNTKLSRTFHLGEQFFFIISTLHDVLLSVIRTVELNPFDCMQALWTAQDGGHPWNIGCCCHAKSWNLHLETQIPHRNATKQLRWQKFHPSLVFPSDLQWVRPAWFAPVNSDWTSRVRQSRLFLLPTALEPIWFTDGSNICFFPSKYHETWIFLRYMPLFVPQILTIDQKCKKYILIQHVSHEVRPILIQTWVGLHPISTHNSYRSELSPSHSRSLDLRNWGFWIHRVASL